MKQVTLRVVFSFIALVSFGAASLLAMNHLPEPKAEPFWTYVTKTDPYTKWNMWPGKDGLYPGTSPHGAFLKLYVNDAAHKALQEGNELPDGSILVKENYDKEKKLAAITPMYLKKGYNPEAGDWFWAKYGPGGNVMAAGKVESCIGCHRAQKNWIFSKIGND